MFLPIYDGLALRHVPRPYVNWSLIAITVAAYFLLEGGLSDQAAFEAKIGFSVIPSTFNQVEVRPEAFLFVWEEVTLLTYVFLHGDLWHLAGNMLFLWVFGDNVEDALGHVKYFIFYFLCAIAAALAQVAAGPASPYPLIGASGAVAGVVAAYLVLHPYVKLWILALGRIPLRLHAGWVLGFWFVVQIVSALGKVDEEVAWWAHIGGFVAGAVLVVVMKRRGVVLFDRNIRNA